MKPVIGITCAEENGADRYFLARAYTEAVASAGGIPLLLPALCQQDCSLILAKTDGLILSGGPDVDPYFFGEEPEPGLAEITPDRDCFEITLTRLALEKGIPVFAICRGIQVLNVAAGGTVVQDISVEIHKPVKHSQQAPRWYPTHRVDLVPGTKLSSILNTPSIRVNSFHHQAVRAPAPGFLVTARSVDGVIEAIESTNHSFALGVQWHPECMTAKDIHARLLFAAFIAACKTNQPDKMTNK
ncbi:gamma-glutamyl-gamma-aminobutyrate hydrolase family protein [Thermincola potens]|uniref:Peptidase C26 n=1 Tax=Thermincola potens (strain JR) TaxID=635013 RepID=D5XCG1_THEPJ|nr:gamma-glutamyl-gamma-aminobutyrate hydrolase family protein [Thermincola potens]ADG81587.1 peptidase C26 [Thermincola potens JR]